MFLISGMFLILAMIGVLAFTIGVSYNQAMIDLRAYFRQQRIERD